MKTISCLLDLGAYGFDLLTGEADNLGFRILTDLTRKGKRIFCDAYGLPEDVKLSENWNTGDTMAPHVASVMLSCDALRQIAPIALYHEGCHTILILENGTACGLEQNEQFTSAERDWEKDGYPEISPAQLTIDGTTIDWPRCYGKVDRIIRGCSNPHVGTRNIHAFSGRIA